jgi:two-component system, OmpR family, KDP operon response regulator KdpE
VVKEQPAGALPQVASPATEPALEGAGAPAEGVMILTVDDDHNALKFLRRLLEGAGYHTMQAADTEEALKALEIKTPDLALLDLVLPDAPGLELMRKIREFHEVPVIFLTARATRDDMVNALKMGADDYIFKPFSEMELLARIEAVLRRNTMGRSFETTLPYQFDGLVIDFEQRRVTLNGQEVPLSATEYKLLSELAKHSGRVMTHEQILHLVWGREYSGETELLRSTVRRLRLKLGENAQNPRFVFTVSQVGYRMAVPSALQPASD